MKHQGALITFLINKKTHTQDFKRREFNMANSTEKVEKKEKVQKETKRGFQRIEQALRTPPTPGEPRFASGVGGVEEVKSGGFLLDV